jgi:dipeptidyl aminopeptidase/acylaminoacyl peptidase
MEKDIRATDLYREFEALFVSLRRPGTGQISDAADVNVSSNGQLAVFTGTLMDTLEGTPSTRIGLTELATGNTRVLTFGPNIDRLPKFSLDGKHIAFLSDRHKAGDFQLFLLDPVTGAAQFTPPVEGWVEYFHWSPDGSRILLGVAGHGAEISGAQGAVTSKQIPRDVSSWMPAIETGNENYRWRHAWVYELATGSVRQVSKSEVNIWEAVWCGNDALAAVVSAGPGEGLWYSARLALLDIETNDVREIYKTKDQLGWPAASPSGNNLAVVEAVCSDRWIVAGDLRVIEAKSGKMVQVDTQGMDVTYTEWRSDRVLLLGGHRGFESVLGLYDATSRTFQDVWHSRDITTGGRYFTVSGFNDLGDCVLIGENCTRAPELAVIQQGEYRPVKSFDLGYADYVKAIGAIECISWKAADELEIQGWLLRPKVKGPYPLVMNVHGGPVWHWRPTWLGRGGIILMLINRGYAVFCPNPRGSSGRGRDFARHVYGDMGGADAQDLLSGLDALVERGMADPKRLGVMGGSYGGFMTSWLITQDARFSAAAPSFPHNNQVTCRLIGNIPHFMDLILDGTYNDAGSQYFERSPVMHAYKAKTPTLNICGALDRCTPPEEATQFHNALLENSVVSVLVTYPDEGHGVRKFPAAIDYATRVVAWFTEHMSVEGQTR